MAQIRYEAYDVDGYTFRVGNIALLGSDNPSPFVIDEISRIEGSPHPLPFARLKSETPGDRYMQYVNLKDLIHPAAPPVAPGPVVALEELLFPKAEWRTVPLEADGNGRIAWGTIDFAEEK